MTAAALGLGARLLFVKLTWGLLLTVLVVVNVGVTSIKDNPSPKEAVLAAGALGCGWLFIALGLANTSLSGLQSSYELAGDNSWVFSATGRPSISLGPGASTAKMAAAGPSMQTRLVGQDDPFQDYAGRIGNRRADILRLDAAACKYG